jgi:hypothetical protein
MFSRKIITKMGYSRLASGSRVKLKPNIYCTTDSEAQSLCYTLREAR